MSELRDLYQEVILDHGRHPRNFGTLADANFQKQGFNPLCGDKINLYARKHNGILEDLKFEGCGCAISMASTSLMTEILKNKKVEVINDIFEAFIDWILLGKSSALLGKLTVLGGVRDFPARVKCATLAWHTLKAMLENNMSPVTTEV